MRRGLIGLLAALALVASACGGDDDTLSEGDIKTVLTESVGLDDSTAECVAAEIGSVPADDQDRIFDEMTGAMQECGAIPDISVPDISIPDISIPDISIDLEE